MTNRDGLTKFKDTVSSEIPLADTSHIPAQLTLSHIPHNFHIRLAFFQTFLIIPLIA